MTWVLLPKLFYLRRCLLARCPSSSFLDTSTEFPSLELEEPVLLDAVIFHIAGIQLPRKFAS